MVKYLFTGILPHHYAHWAALFLGECCDSCPSISRIPPLTDICKDCINKTTFVKSLKRGFCGFSLLYFLIHNIFPARSTTRNRGTINKKPKKYLMFTEPFDIGCLFFQPCRNLQRGSKFVVGKWWRKRQPTRRRMQFKQVLSTFHFSREGTRVNLWNSWAFFENVEIFIATTWFQPISLKVPVGLMGWRLTTLLVPPTPIFVKSSASLKALPDEGVGSSRHPRPQQSCPTSRLLKP